MAPPFWCGLLKPFTKNIFVISFNPFQFVCLEALNWYSKKLGILVLK